MQDDDAPSLHKYLTNASDKEKVAVLLSAVRLARYNCITVLIVAGSDPFLKLNGENAVKCAIRENDMKALLLLVDQQLPADVVNKKPVEVSRSWYDDRKPADEALFIAAGLADVKAVNVLLEFGANPNSCFYYDDEFLLTCSTLVQACLAPSRHLAADSVLANAEAVVRTLVNAGANVNRRCSTGLTPLHWAVKSGLLQSVVLLVEAGADVNAQTGALGRLTPLMMVARLNSDHGLAVVNALLSAGADIDSTNCSYATALNYAVEADSLPIAQFLLEQGANPDGRVSAEPPINTTPLYEATSIGSRAMVVLLLKWGASVNRTVERIPLHNLHFTVFDVALRVNNFELVSVFLAAGFDHACAYKVVCEKIDALCSKVPVGMTDLLSLDDRIRLQRLQKLHGELSQPQTLKQLCRITIRRYTVSPRRLSDLPLPSALQSFLSLDDL